MKKLLMGFAACALIMTSCSKQEMVESITDGQGQLTFAAGTAQQGTKAAELNNTSLQSNAITLYAYQNVGGTWGKWYVDTVACTAGKWALKNSVRFRNVNPTKYITYSSKIIKSTDLTDFTNANFASTYPKFTYAVAENSSSQEDLIAGITEVDANKTDVTLGMRHILSQINFGTVGYKGAKIQIQNIRISGVGNSATFTYKGENTYPIGSWSDPGTKVSEYPYFNYKNVADGVVHTTVPETAVDGDKYIFGDGGNAGPGRNGKTWYPTSKLSGVWKNADATASTGLDNSLMLLPQTLTNAAKVTFEYKIQDVDNAYVAGNDGEWAQGEFSLNFSTGTTSGTHYDAKWEQNYRYVYLIDFTDFLDGIALTFKVDVDMYEWENYNHNLPGDDNGIVDVMAAGQPSQKDMNEIKYNNTTAPTWFIASQSETAPDNVSYTQQKWAQVMRDETWDLSAYDFKNIGVNQEFTLSFQNVIFNPAVAPAKTITMTLPDGFNVTIPGTTNHITVTKHSTEPNTWVISKGDKSSDAKITITNDRYYRNATDLKAGIEAANADALKFGYGSVSSLNLTEMQPTTITDVSVLTVQINSDVIPTVGATTNGVWTWDATTKTATWTKN